ncbi:MULTISPECIES: DUF202 domain-containing protein [Mesonia]|uniref:Uncharacterized protein n=1 Tax=Mesonia oceanica TaxID=2687242 RepID=A0AC61YDC0_9FLAO|nr:MULTISPECIES: DUF202 domain-containing protein [Mesonia]MAN27760.1 hypothetical protein [Mesonia sp.]MAQ40670.1 hypothetical protein [Mesonia sp.]MBJ96494.1 hypothetical protein [Flavobacteriaceae bacterium]VVV02364.1 hypothetical protein FVB9532_03663 [Mesonia oceanica]|tara:strand:+ start:10149 stop:10475 length:327 start_codon:yes stop_codon:yes gene_type:complete
MKKVKLHNPFKPQVINEKKLREHLALERTKLANERTLLAYIRASLYLLIAGIALLQIKEYPRVHWVGYVSLFVCVLFILIGVWRYIALERKLKNLLLPDPPEEEENKS